MPWELGALALVAGCSSASTDTQEENSVAPITEAVETDAPEQEEPIEEQTTVVDDEAKSHQAHSS